MTTFKILLGSIILSENTGEHEWGVAVHTLLIDREAWDSVEEGLHFMLINLLY